MLMFFTRAYEQFATHFLESSRSRFECLGEDCPACASGLRPGEHIYLPAWDLKNRRIVILYFTLAPDGPAPRVLQFLATYREQLSEVVAVIESEGRGKVRITAHAALPETDRGAIECSNFCQGLESETICIRSCVERFPADVIAALPEVKAIRKPLIGGVVMPIASVVAVTLVTEPDK